VLGHANRLLPLEADMIGFLLWFLVVCVVLAVVIIAVRWLMSLAGIAIPQPLMLILGLILFLILLFALWHFVGAGSFSDVRLPR
jgi:hypothetical protein